MTERTHPSVDNVESLADRKIREAQKDGAFDDLPGKGQPLPRRDYRPDWWVVDKVRREQLSILPPALELRRDVERTLQAMASMREEAEARVALEELNARIRKAVSRCIVGPPLDVAPLDVEARLSAWRAGPSRARMGP